MRKIKNRRRTRLNGKGIPLCAQQYEGNDKKLGEVKNTVKFVVLEGYHVAKDYLLFYSKMPNLFISPYSYGG